MMRDKSVLVPVPHQKRFAPCNVREVPESVNLSVRHHHHQTVAVIWNVDVKMDMRDMLITQVIQNVFQLMNVHKDNVVITNIGTNADQAVMKISVVQQWAMEVLRQLIIWVAVRLQPPVQLWE